MKKKNFIDEWDDNFVDSEGAGKKPDENKKVSKGLSIWAVLMKARRIFDKQLNKSNELKLQCIYNFMMNEFNDEEEFWAAYFLQVNRLLDSRR